MTLHTAEAHLAANLHNQQQPETEGTGQDVTVSCPLTTFEGQFQLSNFDYKSTSESGRRRSPRRVRGSFTDAVATSRDASLAVPSSSSAIVNPRKRPHTSSTATSKRKGARGCTGYAPPSTYAHLPHIPDAIAPNLLVLFIGLNPGIETARTGHAYAHPSNLFWKLLQSGGVTPRLCRFEDRQLPELYSLGLTNIVARPTRNGSELSKQEMDDGVAILEDKARRWRPETMCIVGKSIWESIWRVRHGKPVGGAFRYGWQDETENMGVVMGEGEGEDSWRGARVFVASSTSGLAASLSPCEKEKIWSELGVWVRARRAERENDAGKVAKP